MACDRQISNPELHSGIAVRNVRAFGHYFCRLTLSPGFVLLPDGSRDPWGSIFAELAALLHL
jgi:hypothetical protein